MTRSTARAIVLTAILFASFRLQAQPSPQKNPAPNPENKSAANLAHEIQHQLSVLPFYSVFDSIDFTLHGSTVKLTGQVLRPTLKTQADAAIRTLDGVDTVVNQIEVLPPSPSDDELRNALYRSVYEDPALAKYAVHTVPSIHIIVKNGNVTLEGSVDSPADKHVAGARASAVANVRSVANNLSVQAKSGTGQ